MLVASLDETPPDEAADKGPSFRELDWNLSFVDACWPSSLPLILRESVAIVKVSDKRTVARRLLSI